MSDICDMAEGCAAVAAAGGSFVRRGGYVTPRSKTLPPCPCGGRPVYREAPERTRAGGLETLGCPACGRTVGPFSGRQTLALAWRCAEWEREAPHGATTNGPATVEPLNL